MSKNPKTIVNAVPENTTDATEKTDNAPKKPNVLVRGFRKIKENPKVAIATVGGLALVAGAAVLGRSTAPSATFVITDAEEAPEPFYDEVNEVPTTDVTN